MKVIEKAKTVCQLTRSEQEKGMTPRFLYAFGGLVISGMVGLLINLLAAAIEQQTFANHFNALTIWILVGVICFGTLLGAWLGGKVSLPTVASPPGSQTTPPDPRESVSVTRLRAFLSYGRWRGKGLRLTDILLVGSRLDIDS